MYLGDSAAYLFGAMDNGRLPDDRSFTYSLLIRGLVVPFESLWVLAWWQTLAGVGSALLAWHLMVARLAVPASIATVGAALLAIEPAQLYYERMVLAETFGLLTFLIFITTLAAYLASGRGWWLPLIALSGLGAVTLRLNYLPVVIVLSLVAPALRAFMRPAPRWTRIAAHTAVALIAVAVSHGAYQQWVAWVFKAPPGYIARAGFMQLGLVMPLVTPEHLARVGLPPDLASHLRFPLEDPDARMPHMWAAGGFVRTLREHQIPVEPVARALVRMAVADDPLGIVRLGVHTVGNYFREDSVTHALDNDLGRRVIPEEILWTLREIWKYDAANLWSRVTPVSWYFERGAWELVMCLFVLAPLVLATVWRQWSTVQRPHAILLALTGVGLVLAHVLFVPVAFYRYLHPLPVFVVIAACTLATQRAQRIRLRSRTDDPASYGETAP